MSDAFNRGVQSASDSQRRTEAEKQQRQARYQSAREEIARLRSRNNALFPEIKGLIGKHPYIIERYNGSLSTNQDDYPTASLDLPAVVVSTPRLGTTETDWRNKLSISPVDDGNFRVFGAGYVTRPDGPREGETIDVDHDGMHEIVGRYHQLTIDDRDFMKYRQARLGRRTLAVFALIIAGFAVYLFA